MNILTSIYTETLWRPIYNGFILFYNILPWQDAGLAIIIVVLIIRLVLSPFLLKAQKSQKAMAKIQPEMKQIQERFGDNKEAQTKAVMELYAKYKVNPFSGCLIMLVQLPILIAVFHVLNGLFEIGNFTYLYSFVSIPGDINKISFGILNLDQPNIFLGILAAVTQYLQTKVTGTISPLTSDGKTGFSSILQMQMTYIFPVLILIWSYTFQSSIILYWTILNIFGIVQELIVKRLGSIEKIENRK